MTNTPQPTPANDLVERVAREICIAAGLDPDDCVFGRGSIDAHGTSIHECLRPRWQEHHKQARAVVALVLKEAAQIIEQNSEWVRSTDNSRNIQPRTDGDRLGLGYAAAIRALMPD